MPLAARVFGVRAGLLRQAPRYLLRHVLQQAIEHNQDIWEARSRFRILRPAVLDHPTDLDRRVNRRHTQPVAACDLGDDVRDLVAGERHLASEELPQQDPKCVHVHRLSCRAANGGVGSRRWEIDVAGCGLRVAGCGLRVAGCGLRVARCALRVARCASAAGCVKCFEL